MARKNRRNNRSRSASINGREVKIFTNHRLPQIQKLLSPIPTRQAVYRPPALASLPDNRRFYPRRFRHIRPTLTITGERARIKSTINPWSLHAIQKFELPKKVVTCVRRQTRKEIMHATGRAGRRLHYRHVRKTRDSNIKC